MQFMGMIWTFLFFLISLAKQLSQYTLFSAICKPFESNIGFYQNPDLGWKFPTLPWDKKERQSSKGNFYHLFVSGVHRNKKQKRTQKDKKKTTKKERKKEKGNKKNQSNKIEKSKRKIEKEKQVLQNKQCLNHVQSCCKH